jgi:hypothetical protein
MERETRWQPIETAPMDGSWLLICGPMIRPVQAHWNDAAGQWQRYNCLDIGLEPSHWQPLPSPVSKAIGEGE